jgi:hypothetical protein
MTADHKKCLFLIGFSIKTWLYWMWISHSHQVFVLAACFIPSKNFMEPKICIKHVAEAANRRFEREIQRFLRSWIQFNGDLTLLRFDQTLEQYLENDALRDFFLHTAHPIQAILENK